MKKKVGLKIMYLIGSQLCIQWFRKILEAKISGFHNNCLCMVKLWLIIFMPSLQVYSFNVFHNEQRVEKVKDKEYRKCPPFRGNEPASVSHHPFPWMKMGLQGVQSWMPTSLTASRSVGDGSKADTCANEHLEFVC